MIHRPRRLRKDALVRDMVASVRLHRDMFIYPVFVTPGEKISNPIQAMPGVNTMSPDVLVREIEPLAKLGLKRFLLFGTGEEKHEQGHSAASEKSVVVEAIRQLRQSFGQDIHIATDVCLCAYTTHGHCGIIENNRVVNDSTLEVLSQMAVSHAQAGADMVAPSDMMDFRVSHIRTALDDAGFSETLLMAYAVKYASAYYGPFREAADSSPQQGDRKSYQMDFRRDREGILEAVTDEAEGADIIMVKPALAYLDVVSEVKREVLQPVACYNVSGEYAMVKLMAKNGLADERQLVMENMHAFARAGADIIISYHAADLVRKGWLDS